MKLKLGSLGVVKEFHLGSSILMFAFVLFSITKGMVRLILEHMTIPIHQAQYHDL